MEILIPLIVILIAEYIGDFLLQSREIALNKSKDIKVLIKHLLIVFGCIGATVIGYGLPAIYLAGCYVLVHGIQDWCLWNGYGLVVKKRLLEKIKKNPTVTTAEARESMLEYYSEIFVKDKEYAEDKSFYDFIGLDRLLHVATIIILFGVFFL